MIIEGQKFLDLYDAHTEVQFSVEDVISVILQPVNIALVDEHTLQYVSEDVVYLVLVELKDGRKCSTEPITDMKDAAVVSEKLSELCRQFHGEE